MYHLLADIWSMIRYPNDKSFLTSLYAHPPIQSIRLHLIEMIRI